MSEVPIALSVLAGHLAARGVEVAGRLSASRMGGGHSNLTYRVSDEADGRWVARRPPLGNLLASAHDVVRESRILSALTPTDVPVPQIVGVFDDPYLSDRPVVVMEHIEGLVVDRLELAYAITRSLRAAIGPSMTAALAALHAVDIQQVGLGQLSSHRPYAERQLNRWSRQWEETRTTENAAMDRLTAALQRVVPPPGGLALVHGDYHLRNIVLAPSTGSVRAVLDWELSTLGEPMADLGTLLAYWPQEGDDLESALFSATALPGFSTRAQLVASYVHWSGGDVDHLGFWHALALWKVAIIAEGVLRRARDNPGNAADGAPTQAAIDGMIDAARSILAQGPGY